MGMSSSSTKVTRSAAFQRALKAAGRYLQNPLLLRNLVDKAQRKATHRREVDGQVKGGLASAWTTLMTFFRLLRAYVGGHYRDISRDSLLLIVATVVYFLSPIDAIMDFIPGVGYLDDAALLGWCLSAVSKDLARFRVWEAQQAATPGQTEVETDKEIETDKEGESR